MTDEKQKFCPDKFPGLLESPGTYRKSSDDFGVTFAVPASRVEHIQPLMQKAGKLFVVYLVQVSTAEQADALLRQDMDPPADGAALPDISSPPLDKGRDGEGWFVPVSDLADWLCMTDRNVQILESKGIVFKDGRGQYKLKESVQGYIREINRQGDGKNSDHNRERTEAMRLKRMERELDYLERAGKLVNADEVQKAIEKGKSLDRQRWIMMSKFLAPRLEGLTVVEVESALEDYARQSLNQLSAIEISRVGGDAGVPHHGAAAEMDGVPVGRRKKKAKQQDKRRAR